MPRKRLIQDTIVVLVTLVLFAVFLLVVDQVWGWILTRETLGGIVPKPPAKKVEAYIKLQKHKAADRARIALSQPYEVSYWSKKFKVTPARLKAAVAAVGHSSKAVGVHLAKGKATKKAKKSARKTAGKTTKKRAKKKAA